MTEINITILNDISNVNLNDSQFSLLNEYLNYVLEENTKFNLTNITDRNEFIIKHFYDALIGASHLDFNNKKVADIGSGAGFPGIVLAIAYPNSSFYLIEPMKKRADFLNNVVRKLGLKNVKVLNLRMEDLEMKEEFDIITSRAVFRLNILLELSIPFLKVNGVLLAYKGLKLDEEVLDSSNAFKELSCHVENKYIDFLPVYEETRSNIIIKKDKKTKNIYPRAFSKIKRNSL